MSAYNYKNFLQRRIHCSKIFLFLIKIISVNTMADEEDMFADLEQTLCEGLTQLNFKDSKSTSKTVDLSGIDLTCLEEVSNLSKINGPAVRGELTLLFSFHSHGVNTDSSFVCVAYNLWKATEAFKQKKYLDSVYFESFALSLYMRLKFHANKIMESEQHLPTESKYSI